MGQTTQMKCMQELIKQRPLGVPNIILVKHTTCTCAALPAPLVTSSHTPDPTWNHTILTLVHGRWPSTRMLVQLARAILLI